MQKIINKDGSVRWRYQYTDVDGKRRYITAGSKDDLQVKVREKKIATNLLGKDLEAKEDRNRIKVLLGLDAKANEHNLDLSDVLDSQIKLLAKTKKIITARKAFVQYIKERKTGSIHAKVWQPETLSPAKRRLGNYEKWLAEQNCWDTPLHELQELPALYLEHLADNVSVGEHDKVLRLFWGFYKWSTAKTFVPYSPVHTLKLLESRKDKGEADTLSIVEMKAVLRACITDYDHQVCPWIIISLFAGVRPKEFGKKITVRGKTKPVYLTWEDVLGYDGVIVSRELSKTSMERSIDKQDVLVQWLKWLVDQRSEAIQEEHIRYQQRLSNLACITDLSLLDTKREGAEKNHAKAMSDLERVVHFRFNKHKQAWLSRNPQIKDILHNRPDIFRHSFASYMLTKYDRSYVSGQLGDEPKTMDAHYTDSSIQRNKKSSQAYFSLTPKILIDNINLKLA